MSNPFARLEELSAQLNASSDSLTETIKRVEAKLASLRLGISVWLDKPLDISLDRAGEKHTEYHRTWLGYCKFDGKWRLAVRDEKFEVTSDPDDLKPIPLQQASRDFRIYALRQVPDLIKALEAAAELELQNVRTAMAIAENV